MVQPSATVGGYTQLMGGGTTSSVASGTWYAPIGQCQPYWLATEAQAQVPVRTVGVLSNLYCRVPTNTRTIASTLKVRVDAGNGVQSVSIGATTTGEFEDNTTTMHTDTVTAGQLIDYQLVVGTGGSSFVLRAISCSFDQYIIRHIATGTGVLTTASATRYWNLEGWIDNDEGDSSETNHKFKLLAAGGSLQNLFVNVIANTRTTVTTFGSRKNGNPGAMFVSVTSTGTGIFEDNTNTDASLVAGDFVNYYSTTGDDAGHSLSFTQIGCEFKNVTAQQFHVFTGSMGTTTPRTQNANVTSYETPAGILLLDTTEASNQHKVRVFYTASHLGIFVSANSVSLDSTLRFRIGAANGNQVVSITANATGYFEDSADYDVLYPDKEIDYQLVTPNSGTSLTTTFIGHLGSIPGYPATGYDVGHVGYPTADGPRTVSGVAGGFSGGDMSFGLTSMLGYGLLVEYPYAYVAGTRLSGVTGLYIARIEKYDVSTWPPLLVDSADHGSAYTAHSYHGIRSAIGSESGNLLLPGSYNNAGTYHAVVRKVSKTNLSSIGWTYDYNGGATSTGFYDAMMDADLMTYASGWSNYGSVAKMNNSGVQQWYTGGIYSAVISIAGFSTYSSVAAVDVMGSGGGIRQIYHIWKANGQNAGSWAPGDYYMFYSGPLPQTEGGIQFYYLAGYWSDININLSDLYKVRATTWGAQTGGWDTKVSCKVFPNTKFEYGLSACADGTYIYWGGVTTATAATTWSVPVLPYIPFFCCCDLSGNLKWGPEYGDAGRYLYLRGLSCENPGDSSRPYFYALTYGQPPGTTNYYGGPQRCWLEVRNKGDGKVAHRPVRPIPSFYTPYAW